MGSTRRRFTQEYNDHRTIAEVARNIGVHQLTLGSWVKKARDSDESPDKPLDTTERAELERLRAENTELQMQVEFAKKVATWFAKDKR
jgi:transposase